MKPTTETHMLKLGPDDAAHPTGRVLAYVQQIMVRPSLGNMSDDENRSLLGGYGSGDRAGAFLIEALATDPAAVARVIRGTSAFAAIARWRRVAHLWASREIIEGPRAVRIPCEPENFAKFLVRAERFLAEAAEKRSPEIESLLLTPDEAWRVHDATLRAAKQIIEAEGAQ